MKNYNEMTNDEKAQAIYNRLKDQSLTTLSELLMDLSNDYTSEAIFTMEDWLEYEADGNLYELLKTAQESKDLNLNDDYIRESIYYYGYKTANSVLDLVSEDEAIDWISSALDDNDPVIDELNSWFEIEGYLKEEKEES